MLLNVKQVLKKFVHSTVHDLHAMSVMQVKIVYSYYSSERVTPTFLGMSFEAFKWKIVNEMPHLSKTADMDMLQLTVLNEGYQLDIWPPYFEHQIKGILEDNPRPWCFNLLVQHLRQEKK